MANEYLMELIEGSDLAGLLVFVKRTCDAQDWDGLVEIRDQCRDAVDRGKQLWGVAHYVDYRTARDAPASYLSDALSGDGRSSAIGPLWEVAASVKNWDEMREHLPEGQVAALAAYERALRGDVPGDAVDLMLDIPLERLAWEPSYEVATYGESRVDVPYPEIPIMEWVELPDAIEVLDDDAATEALTDLVQPWWDTSNGKVEANVVEGSALEAIKAFGPRRVRIVRVTPQQALSVMVWTAASGGAHGKRRGTPVGRSLAWWAMVCLAGLDDAPHMDPDEIGEAIADLNFYVWDAGDATGGWSFHMAIEDPADGLAWAVTAVDAV
ncbi:MAG: hypothetical protein IIC71_12375 [Acidobacteria bacterium]|nr:hypothetical protein [Acidobacteriota bacterium]